MSLTEKFQKWSEVLVKWRNYATMVVWASFFSQTTMKFLQVYLLFSRTIAPSQIMLLWRSRMWKKSEKRPTLRWYQTIEWSVAILNYLQRFWKMQRNWNRKKEACNNDRRKRKVGLKPTYYLLFFNSKQESVKLRKYLKGNEDFSDWTMKKRKKKR